jgi:hypothetical protein
MRTSQSEELALRQYLLGQFNAPTEIAERLEERIFMDRDFAELASVIEDEIIEDYLEGTLNPGERDAVEQHFLRPPERQEKLRLARLVSRSLASSMRNRTSDVAGTTLYQISKAPSSILWRSSIRLWAELAACVLLVLSLTYAFKAHQEIEISRAQNSQQLGIERDRSGQLERQIQDLRHVAQPATVILSLLRPGIQRSAPLPTQQISSGTLLGIAAKVPTIQIGSGTQNIHVEIVLQSAPPGLVDVRLENAAGKTIRSTSGIPIFRSKESGVLILDVPAQSIESGDYRFVVTQPGGGIASSLSFSFNVSRP